MTTKHLLSQIHIFYNQRLKKGKWNFHMLLFKLYIRLYDDPCLIYVVCVCLRIVVSTLYYVVLCCVVLCFDFLRLAASFSRLSISDCFFGILWRLFHRKRELDLKQHVLTTFTIREFDYHPMAHRVFNTSLCDKVAIICKV